MNDQKPTCSSVVQGPAEPADNTPNNNGGSPAMSGSLPDMPDHWINATGLQIPQTLDKIARSLTVNGVYNVKDITGREYMLCKDDRGVWVHIHNPITDLSRAIFQLAEKSK